MLPAWNLSTFVDGQIPAGKKKREEEVGEGR